MEENASSSSSSAAMQETANAAGDGKTSLTLMFPAGAGEGDFYRLELRVPRVKSLKVSELRDFVVRFAQTAKGKAGLDLYHHPRPVSSSDQYPADRAFSLAIYDEEATQRLHFIYAGGRPSQGMSEDRTMSSIKKELMWPDLEDLRFICSFDAGLENVPGGGEEGKS